MSASRKRSKIAVITSAGEGPSDPSPTTTMALTSPTPTTEPPTAPNEKSLINLRGAGRGREAMNDLEKSMGGRDGVIDALIMAELSPKQNHFLAMLMDPARVSHSIATICSDAAVTPHELLDLFRSASFAKAHTLSLSYIASRSIDVARDVVSKAIDQVIECPACVGVGTIINDDGMKKPCKRCNGTKAIVRESDVDRQKMVLEASGVLKKGGGVNIAVQQNNTTTTGAASLFSKFVRQSDEVAYDVKAADIIDAEVTDVP